MMIYELCEWCRWWMHLIEPVLRSDFACLLPGVPNTALVYPCMYACMDVHVRVRGFKDTDIYRYNNVVDKIDHRRPGYKMTIPCKVLVLANQISKMPSGHEYMLFFAHTHIAVSSFIDYVYCWFSVMQFPYESDDNNSLLIIQLKETKNINRKRKISFIAAL